jgi:ATPases involved in chromosome partitioning
MPGIAVALPPELEGRIVAELRGHGYRVVLSAASADELVAGMTTAGFELAIADADPHYLTAGLLAACDAAGIRLVAVAGSGASRRNAADLGLREVADAGAGWPDIEALLLAGSPIGGAPDADPVDPVSDSDAGTRGQVIAVWGPAGAPGRTTLAISIASELAAEGFSVVLADADTHSGSVAPALGLLDEAPGFAAACRLAATDSLTALELERVGQRYLSPHGSFWVLTGIGRPSRWPELSAERVVTVVAACRSWVDFTVLDTGFSLENDEEISSDLFAPRRNAATISALREADRVIAVGSADPVGLSRFLRAHVDLVDLVEVERVTVVMNKIRASAIGLNPSGQVEQTLQRFGGITGPVLIPHDQASLDAAILGGKTLRDVAGKSPARLAMSRLVSTRILPRKPDAPTGRAQRRLVEPVR